MQPISDTMRAALAGSHVVATLVQVLDSAGETLAEIPDAVDGSVSVERAAVERRAETSFVDKTGALDPRLPAGLAPYGNALRLWRGVRYPDGSTEMVALVTGRIARSGGRYPAISGTVYDYAHTITRARLETVYTIPAGTNYATAIEDLLRNRLPGVVINFPTTSRTTPLIVIPEMADPWEQAQKMAESLGMRLFFDGLGICQMAPEVTADDAAVWSYQEGAGATIVDLDRDLDTEHNYNAVVVTGENPELGDPVRAAAFDFAPGSPTQWGSAYGKVPRFFASEFITTVDQAQDAANAMLLKELGMTEQLQITGLVNPAHEIGDVLAVRRELAGVDENHVLDNVTIPLKGATATIRTRARQVLVA